MTASQHTIAGTVLTMPVQIRRATQHMAMFSVNADAAQRLIDYSGLRVARFLPGRAAVALILAHFIDGDLGGYHELSTAVMVNKPGSTASGPRALQSAFIHHMLVDQAFTLEAGRTIWGFPKIMADFTVTAGPRFGFDCSVDGQLVAAMDFGRGLPIRLGPRRQAQCSYSHLDGVTRETSYQLTLDGVHTGLGGVRVRLGDHPYAKELAALGLPKRAMLFSSADHAQMTFDDAQVIS